jgi:hypothetical protein
VADTQIRCEEESSVRWSIGYFKPRLKRVLCGCRYLSYPVMRAVPGEESASFDVPFSVRQKPD